MKNTELYLLELIFRWRKVFIIVAVLSGILSVVFSSKTFIKPLYRSSTIVYPANIFAFSDETNTEQMNQVLLSEDLKKRVIDSLNLYKHYDINPKEKYASIKVFKRFDKRVSITPTKFGSIKIDVLDRNPEFAYKILNAILAQYNSLKLSINRKRADEIYIIKRDLYFQKKKEVDSLNLLVDSLIQVSELMEYNLLKQSMFGSFSYLRSGTNRTTYDALSKLSLDLFYNQTLLEMELGEMLARKTHYEIALFDTQKQLDFVNTISAPKIPERKVFPVRSLICIISVLSTLFFTFMIIVLIERYKKLNHEV